MAAAGAGDVNGDGCADVIIGAMQNDAGGSNAGRAYVYYGGSTPDAASDLVLTGLAAGEFFGESARSWRDARLVHFTERQGLEPRGIGGQAGQNVRSEV